LIEKSTTQNRLKKEDLSGNELFETLRSWRLNKAREKGVPAFVVLTDVALAGIVALLPTNIEELLSVHGIGQKKMEQYGEELLSIVGSIEPEFEIGPQNYLAICKECESSVKIAVRIPKGQKKQLEDSVVPIPDAIRTSIALALSASPNPEAPPPNPGISGGFAELPGSNNPRFSIIDNLTGKVVGYLEINPTGLN
tara:strand:+ start:309 stop:896 length:588 start_codon:yes stop_codon:yes gene_type:complete